MVGEGGAIRVNSNEGLREEQRVSLLLVPRLSLLVLPGEAQAVA